RVYVVGTADTKGQELDYVRALVRDSGMPAVLVDVGIRPASVAVDVTAHAVGIPKVMVSTLAAGDVKAFVGSSDISMMYSVTDVAGLNRISRIVLGNAAHAIAGMAMHAPAEARSKPAIGLTMFGVTTS